MISDYIYSLLLLLFIGLQVVESGGPGVDFFHQAPDSYKMQPGWQEPGLWRPKWIMERSFVDENSGEVVKKDKVCFKLKPDRTLKIYRTLNRPWIEVFKRKNEEKKKKLFETGEESLDSFEDQRAKAKAIEDVSGTWWWKDEIPLNQGHVKLETREGKGGQDKYLHDIRCDWGAIDSYAAKFRRGKIFKYELNNQGLPLKLKECGTFSIKVSPHRPLVGKDFLSFE